MEIRITEHDDLPALLDIYNYEVTHGTATFDLNPKPMEEWEEWYREHREGNHVSYTAVVDGIPVGYATLSPYRTKEAFHSTVELSIYVHPDYRRRGIADAMMQTLLDHARKNPETELIVSVITSSNQPSITMHEKYGFQHAGQLDHIGRKFGEWLSITNMTLRV